MSAREAVHRDPIWRHRSNFIIATEIDPADTDLATEQIWARKIDERHFEVCCIPFFAYDLSLGDIVETDADYMVLRVSLPSGRYVFRVYFTPANYSRRDATVHALEAIGAQVEWYSPKLLAVDARDLGLAESVAHYLQQQEDAQRLIYETGKLNGESA